MVKCFPESKAPSTNKYVAPYLRDGGAARGTGREPPGARRDDATAIRISNLSNFAVEADLDDLVKGFGPVQKLYLAKEKVISLQTHAELLPLSNHFSMIIQSSILKKILPPLLSLLSRIL